jgi:hypothetical protein
MDFGGRWYECVDCIQVSENRNLPKNGDVYCGLINVSTVLMTSVIMSVKC